MAAETTTLTTANRVEPTYSVWEAAVLLGRSYSWLDQSVRNDRERLAHFRRRPNRSAYRPNIQPPSGQTRKSTAKMPAVFNSCAV
jgi:hypothetical protein